MVRLFDNSGNRIMTLDDALIRFAKESADKIKTYKSKLSFGTEVKHRAKSDKKRKDILK